MVVFKDAKKLSDKQLFFGSLYSFIFCGIYVKLLILNKLYFNLLITLGSRSGQLIVPRSGNCPALMPRLGHEKVPGHKNLPRGLRRCSDRGQKGAPIGAQKLAPG